MTAHAQNIIDLPAGDTRVVSAPLYLDGALQDLSSATITWTAYRGTTDYLTKTKASGAITQSAGSISFTISSADSASLAKGDYAHKVVVVLGGGTYTFFDGTLNIT